MNDRICPRCKKSCLESETVCSCGYNFETETGGEKHIPSFIAACVLGMLLWVTVYLVVDRSIMFIFIPDFLGLMLYLRKKIILKK